MLQVDGGANNQGTVVQSTTANSTAAFQIQNAAGTDVLTVDTTNSLTVVRGSLDNAVIGSELLTGNCSGTNWSGIGAGPYTHATGSTASLTCTITGGVASGATYQVSYDATPSASTTGITPAIGGVTGKKTKPAPFAWKSELLAM